MEASRYQLLSSALRQCLGSTAHIQAFKGLPLSALCLKANAAADANAVFSVIMGTRDLNSGAHTCMAEPSPWVQEVGFHHHLLCA